MKIIGVRNLRSDARNMYDYADVVVEVGFLWWKRNVLKPIFKSRCASYWRWEETGRFTPGAVVGDLIEVERARKEKP
jgi:hypothetical protein